MKTLFQSVRRLRMMLLLVFLASLPASVSGDGGLSPGPGTRGVRVTMEVPFASETLETVRTGAPGRPARTRGDRAIPRHRIDRDPLADPSDLPAPPPSQAISFPAPAVAPRAPSLDSSFPGLGNPSPGEDVIPPDTMGAAGPNHLVSLLNSEFGVFDKNGNKLDNVSLQSFWASLGTDPGEPAHFPFDTKVLWDQHSGRFAAVTLGGTSAGSSWIMIAFSASDNALGTWNKWAIPSDQDNTPLDNTTWADYPGFGLDASNLYVTANMFGNNGFFQRSKVWVIPKVQLLSALNSITWFPFLNTAGSSMQPAHTFGTPGVEYIVYEGGLNQLQLARIENVTGTPLWQPLPPVAVSPYQRSVSLPGAPQAGDSRTIDTSDTRLLNVVYRNGFLWTTHTVAASGGTEVAWYRINPGTSTATAGRISGPLINNTLRWYYYPSVVVNANDVVAIGFSGSSAAEYVGGYYTILRPPNFSAEPVSLLKSGEAPYYKSLSRGDNRWGDFSATVVDPTDDTTFWTLQEYAKIPVPDPGTSTLRSQWGTWWAKFHPPTVSAPTNLTATLDNTAQVILRWADVSNNETGFLIERRRLPGQDYVPVDNVAQNVTTYTDNASKGLLGGFTYSYRVRASDASGGSYSAEAFVTIAAPPPPPSSGGGGGCLSIPPASTSSADTSSFLSLLILFLPAAVYGWKQRSRSGNV